MRILLWEVDVKRASSAVAAGRWFLKRGKVTGDQADFSDLFGIWVPTRSRSPPLYLDGQFLNKSLSRPERRHEAIIHGGRFLFRHHHRMAQHASFFLSFSASLSLSLSLSSLHPSLAACHSSPLMPAAPRSTCTWGSRSRSSACSPRAFPLDSLSGPPRRSPGG